MKPHLQCAEQQMSRSNLTKYCACHAERLTYLIILTYETSFTMRGATGVTLQPDQILRLPRKVTRIVHPRDIWNLIYRLTCLILITYQTSFTMRGATGVTLQPDQILRLPRKVARIVHPRDIWNLIYSAQSNRCHNPTSPNTAPVTQKDSHT